MRLTRRTVLVITPLNGRTRRIGRFGDDGTRLHQALCQFAGASYSRENTPV
ncbi:hypothetical protein [Lentzea sp. HUAS12]|uniref:hypothetical protein n=1 Tax=Lentzea sp. HUAS12 TaxID=2951806 RepID=UPI00209DD487|nr:hypothetical protein [Lentzea sp. HUAS12]USX56041.1 hypothetical protein ND450_18685 [Lentzea sp. HUAS12]